MRKNRCGKRIKGALPVIVVIVCAIGMAIMATADRFVPWWVVVGCAFTIIFQGIGILKLRGRKRGEYEENNNY